MAPAPHPAYTNSSHIMCKYPFSGSLVLLLPLLHRFAPLVSFQTHSNLARTHTHTHTHTHIHFFSSNVRDARLSHSYQHVRNESDSLVEKKKGGKKKHLPCCLRDQSWSCLVWECSVSENRPPCHPWCALRISDRVCRLGGIHKSFSGGLISGRCWQQHMLTNKQGRKPSYPLIDCNSLRLQEILTN